MALQFIRMLLVVALVCVAAAVATPKGRLPLALRALSRTLGHPITAADSAQKVPVKRRLLAFALVVASVLLAVCPL